MRIAFALAAAALFCCCINVEGSMSMAPSPSPYTSADGMSMMAPFTYAYDLPCASMSSNSSSMSSPSSSMMMWRDAIINNDVYAAAMEAWMMWYKMNMGTSTMCMMNSTGMTMNISMQGACMQMMSGSSNMMSDNMAMNYAMKMNCTVSCMWMGGDGKYYMVNEWVGMAAVCYQPPAYMMNTAYPPMDTVNMTMMTGYGSTKMPYSGAPMSSMGMMSSSTGRKLLH